MFRPVLFAAILTSPLPVFAAPPAVVVDIPPIHSIAARIMEGVGTPDLLIAPGASPHDYALRPSEAQRLEAADLVIWVGPDLTLWLADPIATLAPGANVVAAMEIEGIRLRPISEDPDHDHDDHADRTSVHVAADGGIHDPHIWLDPDNAAIIGRTIAAELAALDAENANAYSTNLDAFQIELTKLSAELEMAVAPLASQKYVVFHDAYGYFEDRFRISHAGALSLADADRPGAARVGEVSQQIREGDVVCVFREPQFSTRLVETIIDGTDARSGVLDPIGATLTPGPDLYPELLRNLAGGLAECLAPTG